MKIVVALAAAAIACGVARAAAPSATPVKHPSAKVCNKQADARKLAGDARTKFINECRAGKIH